MLAALKKWGAYLFWSIICATGIVVLGLWAPETKGVPLEHMHELFEKRWYQCWGSKLEFREQEEGFQDKIEGVCSATRRESVVQS